MGLVKNILYKLSNKLFLRTFKNQTIFPYYHLVRNNQVAHIENLYQFKNIEQFQSDIDVLAKNYKMLNPNELFENKQSKNKFLITFDDGLQEIYSEIYPILKKNKINAIFFINPDFVGNNEGLYKHYLSIIISHLKINNFEKEKLEKIGTIFSFSYDSIRDFKQKFLNIKFSEKEKVNEVLQFLNIDIKKYLQENNTTYVYKSV